MKKAKIILIAASAAMLMTGCMSREETERLSAWVVERYTAQAMAARPVEPLHVRIETVETTDVPQMEPIPPTPSPAQAAASEPSPMPSAKPSPPDSEADKPPVSPTPTPKPAADTPVPEPPIVKRPTPQPSETIPIANAPTEAHAAPAPTVAPTSVPEPEPAAPQPDPTPEPEEMTPEPTEAPSGGYAVCSCGATLTPEALVPHMKAHAMNGESHSYRAY